MQITQSSFRFTLYSSLLTNLKSRISILYLCILSQRVIHFQLLVSRSLRWMMLAAR